MATTKITKKLLEQKLMDIINIDYTTNADGEEEKISAMDKQAKVAAIKQLCNMRGYNSPTEKVVTNKNYTLDF